MKDIEKQIQEKDLTAPRITQEQIDNKIEKMQYLRIDGTNTIICHLTLENGFSVLGASSCISNENFDEHIGRTVALKKAKNKIWELEGYLLAENIHNKNEIQFFDIKTKEIIENSDIYFVYNNEVWCDNGYTTESQEPTVSFDDFVNKCPNIGWRTI